MPDNRQEVAALPTLEGHIRAGRVDWKSFAAAQRLSLEATEQLAWQVLQAVAPGKYIPVSDAALLVWQRDEARAEVARLRGDA